MTKRILVVEDQEDLRGIVRDFFSACGYHVIVGGRNAARVRLVEPRSDLVIASRPAGRH